MRSRLLIYLGALIMLMVFSTRTIAQDCYESSIVSPSPFMGNNGEIFKLTDGSLWEVKYEYEYLYEYYPSVVICPSRGKLIVGEKSLNVELVAAVPASNKAGSRQTEEWEVFEETNLKGTISGTVKKGSIFKTISGSVYEVTGITIQVVVEVQPDVMVLKNGDTYKLIVEGFDEPLICKCLNCSSAKRNTAPENELTTQGDAVIESTIDGEFNGFDSDKVYKLTNGQVWKQAKYKYKYSYKYRPRVTLIKSGIYYKMLVDGLDESVEFELIGGSLGTTTESFSDNSTPNLIESYITNDFSGFSNGNIYRLSNGQIWEQTEYYTYTYTYTRPSVTIYKTGGVYKLKFDNIDHAVTVKRIN